MNWIADKSHGSACLIILTDFSGEACGLETQRGPSVACCLQLCHCFSINSREKLDIWNAKQTGLSADCEKL
jgi:hypothetical protein